MGKRRGLFNSNLNLCFVFEAKCSLPSLCNVTVSKRLILNHSSQVSRTRGCFSIVPVNTQSSRSRCIWRSRSAITIFNLTVSYSFRLTSLLFFFVSFSRDCFVVVNPFFVLIIEPSCSFLTFTIFSKVVSHYRLTKSKKRKQFRIEAATRNHSRVASLMQFSSLRWWTPAFPTFASKRYKDKESSDNYEVASNTSRVCVANATMCRSFANVCIGFGMQALATGKPPPKKSAHRIGVLIFFGKEIIY